MADFVLKYTTESLEHIRLSTKGTYFVGYSKKDQCFKIYETSTGDCFNLPCSKDHLIAELTDDYFVFYHKHHHNLHVHVMDIKKQTTSFIEYDDVSHDCAVKVHNNSFLSIVRKNITEIYLLSNLKLLKRIYLNEKCHYSHEYKNDFHYRGPCISPDNTCIIYYTRVGLILYNGEFHHYPLHGIDEVFFLVNDKLTLHCSGSILNMNLKTGKFKKVMDLPKNCSLVRGNTKKYALKDCKDACTWMNLKTFKPIAKTNITGIVAFDDDIVVSKNHTANNVCVYDCESEELLQKIQVNKLHNVCSNGSSLMIITHDKCSDVWMN